MYTNVIYLCLYDVPNAHSGVIYVLAHFEIMASKCRTAQAPLKFKVFSLFKNFSNIGVVINFILNKE